MSSSINKDYYIYVLTINIGSRRVDWLDRRAAEWQYSGVQGRDMSMSGVRVVGWF